MTVIAGKASACLALALALSFLADEFADAVKKLRAAADLTARYAAEGELGRAMKPAQVPLAVKEVDTGPADLRPHFIRAIRTCGGKEAIAALKGLLARHEMKSRVEAAYALKILGDDEALKALPAELARPGLTAADKLAIVTYLYPYYNESKEAIAALRKLVASEKDLELRQRALAALVSHKDAESAPTLWKIADDASDALSAEALGALIKLGDADAIERGLQAIEKGKLKTLDLYQLIYALQAAGGRDIAARLRAVLEASADVSVRMALINALAALKDAKSIGMLVKLADDKNTSVADAAVTALVELAGKSQIELFRKLLKHETMTRRLKAAEALVSLDDPTGIPVLVEALSEKLAYYRQRGVTGLGALRVPDVIEPLISALGDEDQSVRTAAAAGVVGALKQLYPYKRFDLKDVGYDALKDDAEARKKAVAKVQEWWGKNKP